MQIGPIEDLAVDVKLLLREGAVADAYRFVGDARFQPTPQCDASSCYIEINGEYVTGSMLRFPDAVPARKRAAARVG